MKLQNERKAQSEPCSTASRGALGRRTHLCFSTEWDHINITHAQSHDTPFCRSSHNLAHLLSPQPPQTETSQLEAAALPPPAPFVSGHGICRIESDAKAADGIISPVSYAESADLPPVRKISVS